LIWQVLVGLNMATYSSWGVPTIPKVLFKSMEQFGRSKIGFGGVDPRVLFIPSCLGYTGVTGALDRADRCSWPGWPVQATCGICLGWTAWLVCLWVLVLLVGSWSVWSCFFRFCVGFFFHAGCVLGCFCSRD
jgi:hypothetical protein